MAERIIPLRMSDFADLLEAQQAPHNLVLHLRAAADDIERKSAEIANLLNLLADARTESMKLRAALREILGWHDYSNDMHKPIEVRAAYMRARAALEGRT